MEVAPPLVVRTTTTSQQHHQQSQFGHHHHINQPQQSHLRAEEHLINNLQHHQGTEGLQTNSSSVASTITDINGAPAPASRPPASSIHVIHRQQQHHHRPYTSIQDSHYISHLREQQENINFDLSSSGGGGGGGGGAIKSTKSVRGKANNLTCNSTSGGGFSLSSARRSHLVSRGVEFIAHQHQQQHQQHQHHQSSIGNSKTTASSFHLNNNSSSTGGSSDNNKFGGGQTTSVVVGNNKKTGTPNLQKTK